MVLPEDEDVEDEDKGLLGSESGFSSTADDELPPATPAHVLAAKLKSKTKTQPRSPVRSRTMKPATKKTVSKKGKARVADTNASEGEMFDLDAVSGSEGSGDEVPSPKASPSRKRAKASDMSKPTSPLRPRTVKPVARRVGTKKAMAKKAKIQAANNNASDEEMFDLDAVSGSAEDVHKVRSPRASSSKIAAKPRKTSAKVIKAVLSATVVANPASPRRAAGKSTPKVSTAKKAKTKTTTKAGTTSRKYHTHASPDGGEFFDLNAIPDDDEVDQAPMTPIAPSILQEEPRRRDPTRRASYTPYAIRDRIRPPALPSKPPRTHLVNGEVDFFAPTPEDGGPAEDKNRGRDFAMDVDAPRTPPRHWPHFVLETSVASPSTSTSSPHLTHALSALSVSSPVRDVPAASRLPESSTSQGFKEDDSDVVVLSD